MNKLYYGDNLEVLRDKIPDESVDLIYLDPPFQSRKDYDRKLLQISYQKRRISELRLGYKRVRLH